MLSDSKHLQSLPSKRKRNNVARAKYTDFERIELVKLWLATGNLTVSAAALKIDINTAKKWKASEWWERVVTDIRSENQIALSNKLKKIVEKSHDLLMDRLDKGDYIYNQKTGELLRKPLVARDINIIAKDSLDRHMAMEKKPIEQEAQAQISERLSQLADAFAKLANTRKQVNVTDVIYIDAKDAGGEEKEADDAEYSEESGDNLGCV